MYNVGQVLYDKEKQEPVIYCGVVMSYAASRAMPEGVYIRRAGADAMEVIDSFDDLTYYQAQSDTPGRNIALGSFVVELDMKGYYFGVLRPDWTEEMIKALNTALASIEGTPKED